jgi:hypothetical protein
MKKLFLSMVIAAMVVLVIPQALAEEAPTDNATDLAKAAQNPVADMISLPFQWNSYFETGPEGHTENVLLIQPVVPFRLNTDWNFIARPLIPLIDMPPLTETQDRDGGLGNIQFQGFFSPKEKVGDWIIGFGPYLEFPTNSGPDNRFGSDNWSAGPAVVALQIKGRWLYGGLLSQLWSYYGNDPEVNLTSFQPFVNYNLDDGWYLSAAPIITANWNTDSDRQMWTVPVGGGIGKVFKIDKQPLNTSLRVYHNVESPRSGSETQVQFQLQFLFPK